MENAHFFTGFKRPPICGGGGFVGLESRRFFLLIPQSNPRLILWADTGIETMTIDRPTVRHILYKGPTMSQNWGEHGKWGKYARRCGLLPLSLVSPSSMSFLTSANPRQRWQICFGRWRGTNGRSVSGRLYSRTHIFLVNLFPQFIF